MVTEYNEAMLNRKVTYRLYPSASQAERLEEMLGLHRRLYNTALEERIRVYLETSKSLSFADQCKALTQWRKAVPALAGLNAQSEQVTLKRLHLAFQHFFRRIKNGETPGFLDSRVFTALPAGDTRPMGMAGNCTLEKMAHTANCTCNLWV